MEADLLHAWNDLHGSYESALDDLDARLSVFRHGLQENLSSSDGRDTSEAVAYLAGRASSFRVGNSEIEHTQKRLRLAEDQQARLVDSRETVEEELSHVKRGLREAERRRKEAEETTRQLTEKLALVRDFVLDYDRPRAGARQPPQRWIRTRNSIIPEYPSEDDDDDEQEDEEVEHDETVNDDDDDDSEVVVARRPLRASAAAVAAVPVAPAAPPSHAAGLSEAALLRSPASPSGGAGATARRRSRLAVLRDSILGVLSPTSPAAAISPMPTLSEVEEEPLRRRRSEASPAPHTTPTITIESPEPAPKLTSKFPRPKPAANRRPPSRQHIEQMRTSPSAYEYASPQTSPMRPIVPRDVRSEPRPSASASLSRTPSKKWTPAKQNTCVVCASTVYAMEKVDVDGKLYHKSCMRCHHCKTRLTPSTYVLMGNELYCRTHHRQLFLRKGKYVEGDKVGQYGLKAINGGPKVAADAARIGRRRSSLGLLEAQLETARSTNLDVPRAYESKSMRRSLSAGHAFSPPVAPPAVTPSGERRSLSTSINAVLDVSEMDMSHASAPQMSPPSALSPIAAHVSPHSVEPQLREERGRAGQQHPAPAGLLAATPLRSPHSADTSAASSSAAQSTGGGKWPRSGRKAMRRALPHFFGTHTAVFRCKCHQCGKTIGFKHKYLKCSGCALVCHQECETNVPADCGLPAPKSPHSKRREKENQPLGTGITLEEAAAGAMVPYIISSCIQAIESVGLNEEGLYRLSGNVTKVTDLQQRFFTGRRRPNLACVTDVHVITNCLKSFLRQMPDTLLTMERYEHFLSAADEASSEERVNVVIEALKTLPPLNFFTVRSLVSHLQLVAKHGTANKMSSNALSVVFAPVLLRSEDGLARDARDIGQQVAVVETLLSLQPIDWSLAEAGVAQAANAQTTPKTVRSEVLAMAAAANEAGDTPKTPKTPKTPEGKRKGSRSPFSPFRRFRSKDYVA